METTSEPMSGSNGHTPADLSTTAVIEARKRLALVEQARREAIFEARSAHGERPSDVPRPPMVTIDDIPPPAARWKLIAAAVAALATLATAVQQIASALGR